MPKTRDKPSTALEVARAIAAIEALAPGAPQEAASIETLARALEHFDEADTANDAPRDDTAVEITSHEMHTSVHLRLGKPWRDASNDDESASFTQALVEAAATARTQVLNGPATQVERARALDDALIIERVQSRIEQSGIEAVFGQIGWRKRLAHAWAERAKHPEDGPLLDTLAASKPRGIYGKRVDAGRITRSIVHPRAWSDHDDDPDGPRKNGWWTLEQMMADAVTRWCARHPHESRAMADAATIDNLIMLWWKQKWGRMRWEITTPEWVHPALWDLIHDVASDLESLSAHTCEGCGRASDVGWPLDENGVLNGYVTTRCEDCERAGLTERTVRALEREQAGHPWFADRENSLAEVEIDIESMRESKRRGTERMTDRPRRSADGALVKKLTDAIAIRLWGPNRHNAYADKPRVASSSAATPEPEAQLFQITGATAETRTWTRTVRASTPWEALRRTCTGIDTQRWATGIEDAAGTSVWTEAMEETHGERAATEARRTALGEAAKERVRAKRKNPEQAGHMPENQ